MLSTYPAITRTEFYEAAKVLQSAYTTSHQVCDWSDFRRTSSEISIRQRRDISHASSTQSSLVITDEECEIVEEYEEADKVIVAFL